MLRILREFPLVWFLLGSLVAFLCIFLLRGTEPYRRPVTVKRMALGAGLLTLCIFVGLNVVSMHSFMLSTDGLEADILSVALASAVLAHSGHGKPAVMSERWI